MIDELCTLIPFRLCVALYHWWLLHLDHTVRLLGQEQLAKWLKPLMWSHNINNIKIIRAIPKYHDASKIELRVLRRLLKRSTTNKQWVPHWIIRLLQSYQCLFALQQMYTPIGLVRPQEHHTSFLSNLAGVYTIFSRKTFSGVSIDTENENLRVNCSTVLYVSCCIWHCFVLWRALKHSSIRVTPSAHRSETRKHLTGRQLVSKCRVLSCK